MEHQLFSLPRKGKHEFCLSKDASKIWHRSYFVIIVNLKSYHGDSYVSIIQTFDQNLIIVKLLKYQYCMSTQNNSQHSSFPYFSLSVNNFHPYNP